MAITTDQSGKGPREWLWIGGAAAWGLAEGTLFFLLPDLLLTAGSVLSPRRAWRLVVAATLGAVLAGGIMFAWGQHAPRRSLETVQAVPFVRPWMTEQSGEMWRADGVWAIYVSPARGIPYKLNAVQAHRYVSLTAFTLHSVPARAWRFLLSAGVAALIGWGLGRWNPRWDGRPLRLGLVAIFWTINYAIYWSAV